jgi:hypothetical protein
MDTRLGQYRISRPQPHGRRAICAILRQIPSTEDTEQCLLYRTLTS